MIIVWAVSRNPLPQDRQSPSISENPPLITEVKWKSHSPPSVFDTGPIVQTTENAWILNPKSSFPLNIHGVDQSTAIELKHLLDAEYPVSSPANAESIIQKLITTNLRCKEIDEYIAQYKPIYIAELERLKRSSPEWETASEKDKKDMLVEFREKALSILEVFPYCGSEILFECEPSDLSFDDALFARYGYANMVLYLRFANYLDRVCTIPAEHYSRKGFENLVQLGLAKRGADISIALILQNMTLKEMNEMISDLTEKPFTRKAKAIEFMNTLPDLKERVGQRVSYREMFQLRPLPDEYSGLELAKLSDSIRYSSTIAELMAHTYIMGGCALQHASDEEFAVGWEILPANDDRTCPMCKRASLKTYPKGKCPSVPIHVGCRCTVMPILE